MIGEFYDMIDSLGNRNEVRLFIKSLLTADEIANLMRRIEVAALLWGGYKYNEIKKLLSVGNEKISAVHKNLLQDDSGYKIIIKRLIENRKRRIKRNKTREKQSRECSAIRKFSSANRVLPDLIDAVIDKLENNKELEENALLFTPSVSLFKNKRK